MTSTAPTPESLAMRELVEARGDEFYLLTRASGLMDEDRELFGRDDIDTFPVELLKRSIPESALQDSVALRVASPTGPPARAACTDRPDNSVRRPS